jgi:NADH dehydrogenase/NADH:ubiquinone oxidoreductase subunit G
VTRDTDDRLSLFPGGKGLRESAVTDLADVVFPVAPVVEKAGSFVNWEGRIRPFEAALMLERMGIDDDLSGANR